MTGGMPTLHRTSKSSVGQRRASALTRPGQDALHQDGFPPGVEGGCLGLRQHHEVLDEPVQPFRLGLDVVDDRTDVGRERVGVPGKDLGSAVDGRDRRAQLVRQHADERLPQDLRVAARRHVAQHVDPAVVAGLADVIAVTRGSDRDRERADLDPGLRIRPGQQIRAPQLGIRLHAGPVLSPQPLAQLADLDQARPEDLDRGRVRERYGAVAVGDHHGIAE
jgi:hypothetical protein